MNKVILVGRLTQDPIAGNNPERPRANFTLACDDNGRKATGEQMTTFVPCVCWSNSATFAINYLKKGSLVSLEGRIDRRSYVSKETNQNVVAFSVVADRINFINAGSSKTQQQQKATTETKETLSINEVFPESGVVNNAEISEQKTTKPEFNSDDELEWFNNLNKE